MESRRYLGVGLKGLKKKKKKGRIGATPPLPLRADVLRQPTQSSAEQTGRRGDLRRCTNKQTNKPPRVEHPPQGRSIIGQTRWTGGRLQPDLAREQRGSNAGGSAPQKQASEQV